MSAMSDERYTVMLGDRRYAMHRKWAKLPSGRELRLPVGPDGRRRGPCACGATRHRSAGTGVRPRRPVDRAAGARAHWPSRITSPPAADGGMLVADRDAHQVLRFDKDGKARAGAGQAALALARRAVQPSDGGGAGARRRDLRRRRLRQFQRPSLRRRRPPDPHLGRPGQRARRLHHAACHRRRPPRPRAGGRSREQPRAGVRPRRAISSPNGATSIIRCRSGSTIATWCSSPTRSRASACSRSTASWSAAAAARSTARMAWPATPRAISISPSCRRRRSPSSSGSAN